MDAIEGIDLIALTQSVQASYLERQREAFRTQILRLLERRTTATQSILALRQQIAKYEQRVADVNGKLTALEAGQWTVLEASPLPKVMVDQEATKGEKDGDVPHQ